MAQIKSLAREGFYDNVVFHRVIEGFMAQGGDPDGTGMGGSKRPNLKQEFSREPHVRGICSMARSQNPDSANSQFFICFDDAGFLDRQYTVWGKVTDGMEIVDAHQARRTGARARQDRQDAGRGRRQGMKPLLAAAALSAALAGPASATEWVDLRRRRGEGQVSRCCSARWT